MAQSVPGSGIAQGKEIILQLLLGSDGTDIDVKKRSTTLRLDEDSSRNQIERGLQRGEEYIF